MDRTGKQSASEQGAAHDRSYVAFGERGENSCNVVTHLAWYGRRVSFNIGPLLESSYIRYNAQ